VCALPGCDEVIVQPEGGGRRRLYCSDGHRSLANRQRPAPSPAEERAERLRTARALLDELEADETAGLTAGVVLAEVRAQAAAEVATARQEALDAAREAAEARSVATEVQASASADRQRLEATVQAATEDAQRLQEALEASQVALAEAEAGHRDAVASLRNDAAAADRAHEVELDRLEGTLAAERRRADSADAQRDGAERRAAEVAARLSETERRGSELEAQLGEAAGRASLLTEQLAEAESLLNAERERVAALSGERDRLTTALAEAQAAVDGLRVSVDELRRQALVDDTLRANAEERADRAEREARDLAVALARLEQELADLRQAAAVAAADTKAPGSDTLAGRGQSVP